GECLHNADDAEDGVSELGPFVGPDAQRQRDGNRGGERYADQVQMVARVNQQHARGARHFDLYTELRSSKVGRDFRCRYVIDLGPRVHFHHRVVVDRAFEAFQRGQNLRRLLGKALSVEQNALVAGEVAVVVFQRAEVVVANFRVSGVEIGDVDR